MIKTRFIILRKTPYQDSGLILAGISPEAGRVDLMVKGARSIGAKKFPVCELFRELQIQFKEPSGGSNLASPKSLEALSSFDGVASKPESYLKACEQAAFFLKHSRPMLEAQASYTAFRCMLMRLSEGATPIHIAAALAKLAFLHEAGLLPDKLSDDSRAGRESNLLAELLAAACEGPLPKLSEGYWQRLADWIESLASYHGLNS